MSFCGHENKLNVVRSVKHLTKLIRIRNGKMYIVFGGVIELNGNGTFFLTLSS